LLHNIFLHFGYENICFTSISLGSLNNNNKNTQNPQTQIVRHVLVLAKIFKSFFEKALEFFLVLLYYDYGAQNSYTYIGRRSKIL